MLYLESIAKFHEQQAMYESLRKKSKTMSRNA